MNRSSTVNWEAAQQGTEGRHLIKKFVCTLHARTLRMMIMHQPRLLSLDSTRAAMLWPGVKPPEHVDTIHPQTVKRLNRKIVGCSAAGLVPVALAENLNWLGLA